MRRLKQTLHWAALAVLGLCLLMLTAGETLAQDLVNGDYAAIRRHGFGDPNLRLSMLLYGAPPLSGREYLQCRAQHPVATTIGAAVTVVLPWSEYFPDKLINLGSNRYVIRPSLGLLHRRGPWEFEVTTSLSFYQDNDAYYPGASVLERDPLSSCRATSRASCRAGSGSPSAAAKVTTASCSSTASPWTTPSTPASCRSAGAWP